MLAKRPPWKPEVSPIKRERERERERDRDERRTRGDWGERAGKVLDFHFKDLKDLIINLVFLYFVFASHKKYSGQLGV
jgi:hypothetical protein